MKVKLVEEEQDFSFLSLFFSRFSLSLCLIVSAVSCDRKSKWRGGKDVMKEGLADKACAQQSSSSRTYILEFKSHGKIWFPYNDIPCHLFLLIGCYVSINTINKKHLHFYYMLIWIIIFNPGNAFASTGQPARDHRRI